MLVQHSEKWKEIFTEEAEKIRSVLGKRALDIEHIGSTALPGIVSKPIIDIAVALPTLAAASDLIEPLATIGYRYFPESSSPERFFFRKGEPVQFHLSLAQKEGPGYWRRQMLFRDYLLRHADAAKIYEELKLGLMEKDPTGGKMYLDGKSDFVRNILEKAEAESDSSDNS